MTQRKRVALQEVNLLASSSPAWLLERDLSMRMYSFLILPFLFGMGKGNKECRQENNAHGENDEEIS